MKSASSRGLFPTESFNRCGIHMAKRQIKGILAGLHGLRSLLLLVKGKEDAGIYKFEGLDKRTAC